MSGPLDGVRIVDMTSVPERTRVLMKQGEYVDHCDPLVEFLSVGSTSGLRSPRAESREIELCIAAQHEDRKALEFSKKEVASAGISMSPGTRSHFRARPEMQAGIRTVSLSLSKSRVPVLLQAEVGVAPVKIVQPVKQGMRQQLEPVLALHGVSVQAPAFGADENLVHARSGDKGNGAHARGDSARRAGYFRHLVEAGVTRYELPGTGTPDFSSFHFPVR